jgi:hypothetical protein
MNSSVAVSSPCPVGYCLWTMAELQRPSPRVATAAAADCRHGVQDRLDQHAVVPIRAGDKHVERQPVRVDEQVVLAAGLAPIGRVRAGQLTPLSPGR